MPVDNGVRLYNDERFAPRSPNSGKHKPEESIRHSNLRPLVRTSHYDQLLAKRKVFGSEIRGDFELRPNEQNKISKRFHHDSSLAGACKFVNDFQKYEYVRRTANSFLPFPELNFEDRSIFDDPSLNRSVIELNASFFHEFFDITVTQAVPQIPENRLKNDALWKMPTVKPFLTCN
jgi:hypothetical protein